MHQFGDRQLVVAEPRRREAVLVDGRLVQGDSPQIAAVEVAVDSGGVAHQPGVHCPPGREQVVDAVVVDLPAGPVHREVPGAHRGEILLLGEVEDRGRAGLEAQQRHRARIVDLDELRLPALPAPRGQHTVGHGLGRDPHALGARTERPTGQAEAVVAVRGRHPGARDLADEPGGGDRQPRGVGRLQVVLLGDLHGRAAHPVVQRHQLVLAGRGRGLGEHGDTRRDERHHEVGRGLGGCRDDHVVVAAAQELRERGGRAHRPALARSGSRSFAAHQHGRDLEAVGQRLGDPQEVLRAPARADQADRGRPGGAGCCGSVVCRGHRAFPSIGCGWWSTPSTMSPWPARYPVMMIASICQGENPG